jgi:CDP-diacylglycerol--glycerol-3-phosphate 3-phosphatidyltransferase
MIKKQTIPNVITVGRIVLTPFVAWLMFIPTFTARLISFIIFLIAAFSDLVDGNLARKHGWISDFGKLMDPIADKLLLFCTLIPFHILSHQLEAYNKMPFIGVLPFTIVAIIIGRELLVTFIRSIAAKRGIVIPAGKEGKLKAVFQNIFIGVTIFWLALRVGAETHVYNETVWSYWQNFHGAIWIATLAVAVYLTVYSLVVYLMSWRKLASSL